MIIDGHIPSMCGSLPFIDHVAQTQMLDITKIKVEIAVEPYVERNPRTYNKQSWKSRIQKIEEAIQWLKQGLGSFDQDVIMDCIQTRGDLLQNMYGLGAPKSTIEEDIGSISWK